MQLVLTYNQFNTGTKRILLDNFEMLLSDPATRTIYPELPLVSYRRDINLRDYLVSRCFTCRHITSQTILQSLKRLYTIRDRFSCQSENVVTPSYVVAAVAYTLESFRLSRTRFSHSTTSIERAQTNVMLAGKTWYRRHFSTRFCKNVVEAKQVNNKVVVCHFSIWKRAKLPATWITKESTLLTKSKINLLCHNFIEYFC